MFTEDSLKIQTRIILFLVPKYSSQINSIFSHLQYEFKINKKRVLKLLKILEEKGVISINGKYVSLNGINNDIAVFRDMVFCYHHKQNLRKIGKRLGINDYIIYLFMICCHLNGKLESKYHKYMYRSQKEIVNQISPNIIKI